MIENLDKIFNTDIDTNDNNDNQLKKIDNREVINEDNNDNNDVEREEVKRRGRPPKKVEKVNEEVRKENVEVEKKEVEEEKEDINPLVELASYIKTKNNWEDFEFDNFNDIDEFAETINKYIEKNKRPKIEDSLFNTLYEYVELGGDVYDFISVLNSDNVSLNLKIDSDQDRINLLFKYFKDTTNWDEEKIKHHINKLHKGNLLEEETSVAIDYYVSKKVENINNILEEKRKQKEEIENNYKKTFDLYMDYIYNKNEQLLGEKLDKKTKDSFSNFIFQKGEDGYTEYQKMLINNPELELKFAYMLYKDLLTRNTEYNQKVNLINKLKNQINVKSNNSNSSSSKNINETLNNIFNNI